MDKTLAVPGPAEYDTMQPLTVAANRITTTLRTGVQTVTYLDSAETAEDTFHALANDHADVAMVLWQTKGSTDRPRFQAVSGVIHTTLPV